MKRASQRDVMRPGYSPSNMFRINYLVSLTAVSCIEVQFGNHVNGDGGVLTVCRCVLKMQRI